MDKTTLATAQLDGELRDLSDTDIPAVTQSSSDLQSSLDTLNVTTGVLSNSALAANETSADMATSLGIVQAQLVNVNGAASDYAQQLAALDDAGQGNTQAAEALTAALAQENQASQNLTGAMDELNGSAGDLLTTIPVATQQLEAWNYSTTQLAASIGATTAQIDGPNGMITELTSFGDSLGPVATDLNNTTLAFNPLTTAVTALGTAATTAAAAVSSAASSVGSSSGGSGSGSGGSSSLDSTSPITVNGVQFSSIAAAVAAGAISAAYGQQLTSQLDQTEAAAQAAQTAAEAPDTTGVSTTPLTQPSYTAQVMEASQAAGLTDAQTAAAIQLGGAFENMPSWTAQDAVNEEEQAIAEQTEEANAPAQPGFSTIAAPTALATAEANTAAPASGSAGYAAYESAATTTTYPGSAQPLPSAGYNAAPTSLPLGYNAEAAAASEWTSANPSVPQMVNPYESSELAALFGGSTSSGNTATPAATGSQITINITGMTTQNAQSVAQQMVTALKNAGIGKLT